MSRGAAVESAEGEVRTESGRVEALDGVELFWREWGPPGSAPGGRQQAVILFVHGAGEHSGRYEDFGRYFASRGVPVVAYDHRGLGRSGGPRGHVDRFSDYISDLMLLRDFASGRYPGAGVILVGHSMGGLISLAAAEAYPEAFAAVVVSGPCLGLAVKVPGWKAFLGRVMARVFPRLTMANEIDPGVLARNPEVGRRYMSDPHVCRVVSAGWFVELLRAMEETNGGADRIRAPVFILQGTADRLVDPSASRAFFERLADVPKEFRFLEGFYHELFQEDERHEVFSLIEDWLVTRGLIKPKVEAAM